MNGIVICNGGFPEVVAFPTNNQPWIIGVTDGTLQFINPATIGDSLAPLQKQPPKPADPAFTAAVEAVVAGMVVKGMLKAAPPPG